MIQRPPIVTDEHLEYLDDLRESGAVNMFASGLYLRKKFGLSREDAKIIWKYWAESFEERKA